jgi:hypothetical protein
MKFIVTNTQLHNIMVDYLDNVHNSNREESRFDSVVVIHGREDYYHVIMKRTRDKKLYIDKSFLETFSKIFPLSLEDSAEFIKNWFEHRFNIDVDEVGYEKKI